MASAALLSSLQARLTTRRETRHAWLLAATSCALGKGPEWLPLVYQHATQNVPKSGPSRTPPRIADEQNERRKIFRMLKEALLKSVILCGVPRVIESTLALGEAVDPEDLPREEDDGYRLAYRLDEANIRQGRDGLRRVYKETYRDTFRQFRNCGAPELQWLSEALTYGLLLAPCSDTPDAEERAPLTFAETEIAVLSCTTALKSAMTTRWHLLGALRSGLTRQEIEDIQQAIEEVAQACGEDVRAAELPRVADIRGDEI